MTPQSALRLPAPLKEEPRKKSPLIEEMPDRAEELFLPSSKGAGLAIIPLSAKADIPLFKGDNEKASLEKGGARQGGGIKI